MADTVYKVKDPSGKVREIRGPEGASDDEVIAQAQKLFAADTTKPSAVAQYADVAAGIPEAALGLASGAVAAPVAGLAGMVASAIPGLPEGTGANVVNRVSDALTYSPRTQMGQNIVKTASVPFEWLAKQADTAGGAVTDVTGSPAMGAAANTTIQALPLALTAGAAKMGPVKGPSPQAIAGREAGLSMTPGDMGAGWVARTASSIAGEPRLARHISQSNAPVFNNMIARDLKLPADTPLDRATIEGVRKEAHRPYETARSMGAVEIDGGFRMALDKISSELTKAEKAFPGRASPVTELVDRLKQSKSADADGIVSEINTLRSEASDAYAAGKRDLGKASRAAADALEAQLIRHAEKTGQPAEAVSAMREARSLIAKTYAAEKALSGTNINPQVYAAQLRRGAPLSGEARAVAEFADRFPRSSMNTRNIGETGMTFADVALGGLTGEAKMLLLRPALRGVLSSSPAQAAMMNTPAILEAIRRGQASPLAGILEMSAEQR